MRLHQEAEVVRDGGGPGPEGVRGHRPVEGPVHARRSGRAGAARRPGDPRGRGARHRPRVRTPGRSIRGTTRSWSRGGGRRGSRPPSSRSASPTGAGAGGSGGRSGSAATPGAGANSSSCGGADIGRRPEPPRTVGQAQARPSPRRAGQPRRRRRVPRRDLLHDRAPAGVGLSVRSEPSLDAPPCPAPPRRAPAGWCLRRPCPWPGWPWRGPSERPRADRRAWRTRRRSRGNRWHRSPPCRARQRSRRISAMRVLAASGVVGKVSPPIFGRLDQRVPERAPHGTEVRHGRSTPRRPAPTSRRT